MPSDVRRSDRNSAMEQAHAAGVKLIMLSAFSAKERSHKIKSTPKGMLVPVVLESRGLTVPATSRCSSSSRHNLSLASVNCTRAFRLGKAGRVSPYVKLRAAIP